MESADERAAGTAALDTERELPSATPKTARPASLWRAVAAPYGGWPSQPPGGPQWGPPQPPPPKKRHLLRNTLLAIGGVFLLIIVIAIAAAPHSGNSTNAGNSIAASSAPASSPAAQKPSTVPATHAAAFQPQTLLNISGSGDNTTARFTVGGSGNRDIIWSYNEGNFGQSVNFGIVADNGSDFNFNGPNQLGTGGSGVTHVYNDAGTHYQGVLSEGNWVVKVVTAP